MLENSLKDSSRMFLFTSYEFLSNTLLDQLNVSFLFRRFIDLHDVIFFFTHNQNRGHMCRHAPVHAASLSTFPSSLFGLTLLKRTSGCIHRPPHAVLFSRCLRRLRHVLRYVWQVVRMRAVSGFCSCTLEPCPQLLVIQNCGCHPCSGKALCFLFYSFHFLHSNLSHLSLGLSLGFKLLYEYFTKKIVLLNVSFVLFDLCTAAFLFCLLLHSSAAASFFFSGFQGSEVILCPLEKL